MSEKKTLHDLDWRGGANFKSRTTGKVKIKKTARSHKGRWVEFIKLTPNIAHDFIVSVWIEPAERELLWSEIEAFKFTPDEFKQVLERERIKREKIQ